MCKNPYVQGVHAYGCGQCLPCRINRRRLWTHRMILESLKHAYSSFVTLTYAPEHIPKTATLVPRHAKLFLKRLRRSIAPLKVRYFLVGEYGDQSFRPHYHMALFGYPTCLRGRTDHRLSECCVNCQVVKEAWGLGGVDLGSLTSESAQYIGGYVTKKMTKGDDPRLCQRHPEFARMSLKPGIGALAMRDLATVLLSEYGILEINRLGDVPSILCHGKKKMPLGRYLRRVLRGELGFSSLDSTEAGIKKAFLEMRVVLEEALVDPKNTSKGVKEILVDMNRQKVLNLESRTKIYSGGKSL